MDSRELAEWMAYSALEPWGEDRDDLRHSITAATISRGLGLRLADPLALYPAGRATEPPEQPMQPKQQSLEQMKAPFKRLAALWPRKRKR